MSYSRKEISRETIQNAIEHTKSMAAAARYLQVSRDRFNRYAKKYGLFNPNQAGRGIKRSNIYSDEDIFRLCEELVSPSVLISKLKSKREWKCECCGLNEWMGRSLPLEIHHIDGNRLNNSLNNLQILCPNCHSQTPNWRSRNQKGYAKSSPKISDEQLLEAVKTHKNIYNALKSLGLAGGTNYMRVYKLLEKEKETQN